MVVIVVVVIEVSISIIIVVVVVVVVVLVVVIVAPMIDIHPSISEQYVPSMDSSPTTVTTDMLLFNVKRDSDRNTMMFR